MIRFSQALEVVSTILNGDTFKAYSLTKETKATIDKAIKENFCGLVEKSITVLQEETIGNLDLVDSLTQILEGEQEQK